MYIGVKILVKGFLSSFFIFIKFVSWNQHNFITLFRVNVMLNHGNILIETIKTTVSINN